MKPKKKTFIREVILNPKGPWADPKVLIGNGKLGPGVLYAGKVTYTDRRGQGFNAPMFAYECLHENEELFHELFAVRRTEVKKKKKRSCKDGQSERDYRCGQ